MCGVAGVFRFAEDGDDRTIVAGMLDALQHRGPDDHGLEHDGPVTFGHRRLAILDLSSAGHQPMHSPGGRYVVSFNGEIYNYDDLRAELGIAHEELNSTSDTEILLHAWERWGADALDRFVGQFAFAIHDRNEHRLWLARDRFGEKPLFYRHEPAALWFASSIPALLRVPGAPRTLDSSALLEYVTMRYVVSPRTIVGGIRKLPPGHIMRADRSGVEISRWYRPRFRSQVQPPTREEAVERFGELLVRASRRCTVSDMPVALFLSDGIDSNGIRAALPDESVRSLTFTATTESNGQKTVTRDGVTELRASPAERIDHMIEAFSAFGEPTGDGAALATWMLIRQARAHATVFLCGHGGDEVLGGYRLSQDRFRLSVAARLARLPGPWTERALSRWLNGAEPFEARRSRLVRAGDGAIPAAARYMIHRPLPVMDVEALLGRAMAPGDGYLASIDRLYGDCEPQQADLDCMQQVMLNTFLSENILAFADSMAMASSAELRMPFLDRDLVEFVLTLPPQMRVGSLPGRTNTKQILRWWSEGRVASDVISRRKRGFPFGNLSSLLRTHGDTVRERVLGSRAIRDSLPGVERWLSGPPEYYRDFREGTLWALLSLAIWSDAHGVQPADG